jgi:hypothetical protein
VHAGLILAAFELKPPRVRGIDDRDPCLVHPHRCCNGRAVT